MSEKLQYISLSEIKGLGYVLNVQLDGGGASQQFNDNDTAYDLARKLIIMGNRIANDAMHRARQRPLP